jgi:peroxiredoxin
VGFRLLIVAAVLVAVAMGAIGWAAGPWRGAGSGSDQPASSAPAGDSAGGMTTYRTGSRILVPDVSGRTLTGSSASLHGLRGHVVVLNVWASWCYPCQSEAPGLARIARAKREQGVRFLGIDTRDTSGAAQRFVHKYAIPYPSITDPKGDVVRRLDGLVPVDGVPSTLVIDPSGRVAARKIGILDEAALRKAVDGVLAERGAGRP